MGKRRDARVIAFCAVYEREITKKNSPEVLVEDVIKLFGKSIRSDIKNYAFQLVEKVVKNTRNIETKIAEHLTSRSIEEILPIEKALIMVGVAEMLYFPDVPYITVINEIIELAKEYGGSSSSKFVNGVLHAVYKELKDADSGAFGHTRQ